VLWCTIRRARLSNLDLVFPHILRKFCLGQVDIQHAVFHVGFNAILTDVLGKCEAALEIAIEAFDTMALLVLFFFTSLTSDAQDLVFEFDFEIFFPDRG
jgi:hypothetical protein